MKESAKSYGDTAMHVLTICIIIMNMLIYHTFGINVKYTKGPTEYFYRLIQKDRVYVQKCEHV